MTNPSRPLSDPTRPKFLEGDEVLKPPLVDDVEGHAGLVGADGDPRPTPETETPDAETPEAETPQSAVD